MRRTHSLAALALIAPLLGGCALAGVLREPGPNDRAVQRPHLDAAEIHRQHHDAAVQAHEGAVRAHEAALRAHEAAVRAHEAAVRGQHDASPPAPVPPAPPVPSASPLPPPAPIPPVPPALP
jgi:hypothetical protein